MDDLFLAWAFPLALMINTRLELNKKCINRLPCNLQGSLYLFLLFPIHSLQRGIDHAAPGQ